MVYGIYNIIMAGNSNQGQTTDAPPSQRDDVIFNPNPIPQYADLYQSILQSTKNDVRESIVENLTNCRWGETRIKTTVELTIGGKKQSIPTTKKTEGWISNVAGAKKLMPLENALEIADYVSDQVDVVFSTTYYDPSVKTLHIAALLATIASHMLDNPRYDFKGNETDSAAFAVKVVSKLHASMNRSIGGFMTKQMSTSTQNVYRHDVKEGDFVKVKDSGLEKFFGLSAKK